MGIGSLVARESNFFRVHLLYFLITPCIAAAVLYASADATPISYVDALFICVSAHTVTGLNTVLLAPLTRWQQGILFILMTIGSTSVVSLVTIKIRQHFFRRAFRQILDSERKQKRGDDEEAADHAERKRKRKSIAAQLFKKRPHLTTSMIRRVDSPAAAPRTVNNDMRMDESPVSSESGEKAVKVEPAEETSHAPQPRRQSEPEGLQAAEAEHMTFQRSKTHDPVLLSTPQPHLGVPRSTTIDFAAEPEELGLRRRTIAGDTPSQRGSDRMPRSTTREVLAASRDRGFGGFPNPVVLAFQYLKTFVPSEQQHWDREATKSMRRTQTQGTMLRRTGTVTSTYMGRTATKPAPYLTFDAEIGRNSRFKRLTRAQRDELGGVEYRALSALFWIVLAYILGWQLIMCTILAPYLSTSKFDYIFQGDGGTNPTWFTFFQIWSAWSNNGMSLLDASMIPFQYTYLLIVLMAFTIYAGNTAFPIFLRFFIWLGSLVAPLNSQLHESLQFILDHPRRVYIYLFPSYQTWLLVAVLVLLNGIDWFFFVILDIGNPVLEALPVRTRVADGMLQSAAVRAAGFAIVPLGEVAPALQALFVVMMYIAVYPIAMSIRSTNVYEQKSLGVFDESDDESEHEAEFDRVKPKLGTYIAYHARRQLSFDMWYLVLALFLIAIIEKDKIEDVSTDSYFNLFTIIFELSSAYGTVGLSLGSPNGYSLSGDFRPLSKLVVMAVMIRGRHRGLPIAIDKAVLLPRSMERIRAERTVSDDPDVQKLAGRRRKSSNQLSRFGTMATMQVRTAEDSDVFEQTPPSSPRVRASVSPPASPRRRSVDLPRSPQRYGSLTFDESAAHTALAQPSLSPIESRADELGDPALPLR